MKQTKQAICFLFYFSKGFPGGSVGKEPTCKAGRPGFDPWVGKIPWRREGLLTPVFLPREFHGHRSLVELTFTFQILTGHVLYAGHHES